MPLLGEDQTGKLDPENPSSYRRVKGKVVYNSIKFSGGSINFKVQPHGPEEEIVVRGRVANQAVSKIHASDPKGCTEVELWYISTSNAIQRVVPVEESSSEDGEERT